MIIKKLKDNTDPMSYPFYGGYPDTFESEKKKQSPDYIKKTMDYFATFAYMTYTRRRERITRNYNLMNGILDAADFYQETEQYSPFEELGEYREESRDLLDLLKDDNELPSFVKHYPIINSPVNVMLGELTNRPDVHRIRAFDDLSQSEEFEFKTNLVESYITQEATKRIIQKLQMQGADLSNIDEEQLNNLTMERVQEQITDYSSQAEIWANATLDSLKAELSLKDKSEDAFRDFLIVNEEYLYIYRNNSKRKLGVRVVNPKNFFGMGMPDQKYAHQGHVTGIIEAMEIGQIIEEFPWLTKEEIDYLKKNQNTYGPYSQGTSNVFSSDTGIETIKYDTYSRLLEDERRFIQSELEANGDLLESGLMNNPELNTFGYKYAVVRVYVRMHKKVGKLTYLDQDGIEQTVLVDESYVMGSPNEINIDWGYVEQLYEGVKIGPEIYHLEPYTLIDDMPIVGVRHNIKNSKSVSLVDLMKPHQVLFNIYMNKLYELIEKDMGILYQASLRHVPTPKDGDRQDAIDEWEQTARDKGIIFLDDSPENTKGGSSFNQFSRVDLSRAGEMQAYYNLAAQIKLDCWQMVGMNQQRLGSANSSETATGLQANLTQSFAQTEPYFQQHEYLMDEFYQRLLDAVQTIESNNDVTTLSSINSMGMDSFIRLTPADIRLRDLHVISVSRSQDNQAFQEFKQLSQAMLQNGADPYDISIIYNTNSMRMIQKQLKQLKDYKRQMEQQQQQLQQQQIESQQQVAQQQIEAQNQRDAIKREDDNYNKERDRQVKLQLGAMQAASYGNSQSEDDNKNNIPDVLELNNSLNNSIKTERDYAVKIGQLTNQSRATEAKLAIEKAKIELQKANMKNDLEVARINASNRKSKKS